MKDIQGIMRGKCNLCDECEEYIAPKEGARCDYCNHTPIEHVRIIKLGACRKCSSEECSEYISGEKSSYTDCQYCGCKAMDHAGAEKLRKKPPAASATASTTASDRSQSEKCKNPGCTRQCYTEKGGKKHDFCGRTCATKYKETYGSGPSFHAAASGFQMPLSTAKSTPPAPYKYRPAEATPLTGGKLCAKCGLRSANEGYAWCQSCFESSKTGNKK